jgi:hypothetical protein
MGSRPKSPPGRKCQEPEREQRQRRGFGDLGQPDESAEEVVVDAVLDAVDAAEKQPPTPNAFLWIEDDEIIGKAVVGIFDVGAVAEQRVGFVKQQGNVGMASRKKRSPSGAAVSPI